jgi:hypothetical protein
MNDKTADLAGPGISTYEEVAKILPNDYAPLLPGSACLFQRLARIWSNHSNRLSRNYRVNSMQAGPAWGVSIA